jgi:hypothetical protein
MPADRGGVIIVPTTKRCPRRTSRPRRARLRLEGLESRCLLSAPGSLSPDALFHETLDAALDLNTLGVGARVTAAGTIGAGPEGAADVNWYQFAVSDTAEVRLSVLPGANGRPLDATLSLYNDAPLSFNPLTFSLTDPYTPDGHRLLAQDDGGVIVGPGQPATIDRLLGPGTYWVAVSGSGNDQFSPFLAGSGLDGRTGSYRLSITASDPGADYDSPATPVVLASDPAPGAVLGQSPFVLRFDLNAPLDDDTVAGYFSDPTTLAQFLFNTTNDFGPDGTASDVTGQYLSFATVALEPNANELQIALGAPLASGFYEVILPGFGPGGSDYVAQFQVAGPAGNFDPTQQPGTWTGTAYDITSAADGRLHQISGAVGVDPTDPSGFYQAGVGLYHFSINHPGTYALDAEVFAGRIGSPLDASLTLFKMEQGTPTFVASNGGVENPIAGTNNVAVLFTDPALFAALGPGDYYLAVSAGVNFPDPYDPTNTTYFDPSLPQSGSTGISLNTTGSYVLNVLLQRVAVKAPHVVSVRPDMGPNGDGPLTAVRVRFDQPVNLLELAFDRYLQIPPGGMPTGALESVTLSDGVHSFDLRLGSYDDATNTATFILLDSVPPGRYTLALSGAGPEGIAGLGGARLAGNGGSTNDFTTSITVVGAPWEGNDWVSLPGFNDPQHAQPIGVLFPVQMSEGVTITHDPSAGVGVTEADYAIELLQSRTYTFSVDGDVPPGCTITVLDANGTAEAIYTYVPGGIPPDFVLSAGPCTLQLTCPAGLTNYAIHLGYSGSPENPTPLVVGPGPALRVRLLTGAPGAAPPSAVTGAGNTPPAVTPVGSASGFLPGIFALPSSGLLAQGFSPLEGVLAAGGADFTGGDRLLVQTPTYSNAANSLLNLVIVTQAPLTPPAEGDQSVAKPPTTPNGQSLQSGTAVPEMAARLLDFLFEFWGWFSAPLPAPEPPEAAEPSPPAEGGSGEGDLSAIVPVPNGPEVHDGAWAEASWVWVSALAGGAMAMAPIRARSSVRVDRIPMPMPRTR